MTTTRRHTVARVDIGEHVADFNRTRLLGAIGYALASLVLWLVSYWLVLSVVTTMFVQWHMRNLDMALWISLGVMGLLLIEGVRTLRSEQVESYTGQTSYVKPQVLTDPANAINLAQAVSEVLLCAPHSMARAFRSYRRRVRADSMQIAEAQRIFDELQRAAAWRDLKQYVDRHVVMGMLQHIGLIWIQEKEGRLQVRADPSYT